MPRAKIVEDAGNWPWSRFEVRLGRESSFELGDGPMELPDEYGLPHFLVPVL